MKKPRPVKKQTNKPKQMKKKKKVSVSCSFYFPPICTLEAPAASLCWLRLPSESKFHLCHCPCWKPCPGWSTLLPKRKWVTGLILWVQMLKKVSTNVISFLEKVLKDCLIADVMILHCFCILMFFFSVWLMLTFRSRLIYFILFIGWGQALCKLWAAFSVNQNI